MYWDSRLVCRIWCALFSSSSLLAFHFWANFFFALALLFWMVYTVQLYTVYIIRNVIPPTQYFILRDASVFIPGFYLVVCNKMLEQWNAAYRCILYYISNYGIGFIFPRIFWFSLHERVAFCHGRRERRGERVEKEPPFKVNKQREYMLREWNLLSGWFLCHMKSTWNMCWMCWNFSLYIEIIADLFGDKNTVLMYENIFLLPVFSEWWAKLSPSIPMSMFIVWQCFWKDVGVLRARQTSNDIEYANNKRSKNGTNI